MKKIKKDNKKIKNSYSFMFISFLLLTVVFSISPLLTKCVLIHDFIVLFISALGDYKEVYISSLGAILGTGVAVSSALYLQQIDNIKRETEKSNSVQAMETDAVEIINNWINRELNMLWGLWVWTTYDSSFKDVTVFEQFRGHLYFEPYEIDNKLVFENYTIISKYLPSEEKDTFLKFYYLSEKINIYIKNYNRLNYEIPIIQGDFPSQYNHGSGITTSTTSNESSVRYKKILKFLMNKEEIFLFFSVENAKIDVDKFFKEFILYRNKRDKIFELAISSYTEKDPASEYSNKPELYINSFINSRLAEQEYGINSYIEEIIKIDDELKNLSTKYEEAREKHYKSVDNEYMISEDIKKLMLSLNTIN